MSGEMKDGSSDVGQRAAEIDLLRAEVVRLRRLEKRHLTELAEMARIAEARRSPLRRLEQVPKSLKQTVRTRFDQIRPWMAQKLPPHVKRRLRRLLDRFL